MIPRFTNITCFKGVPIFLCFLKYFCNKYGPRWSQRTVRRCDAVLAPECDEDDDDDEQKDGDTKVQVDILTAMGFSESESRCALVQTANNVGQAIERLLNGGGPTRGGGSRSRSRGRKKVWRCPHCTREFRIRKDSRGILCAAPEGKRAFCQNSPSHLPTASPASPTANLMVH